MVEADLADALFQDLERRPGERASPAIGLLLIFLHVRFEVFLRARRLELRVPARGAHDTFGALEAVTEDRESRADRRHVHGGVVIDLLGLAGHEDVVRRIGAADEGIHAGPLELLEHRGDVLDAQWIAARVELGVDPQTRTGGGLADQLDDGLVGSGTR